MAQSFESKIIAELRQLVGKKNVATDEAELVVYECDAIAMHKARPLAVVFPHTTEEVSHVVKLLHDARIPFGPRGAGTGLSSGSIALGCEKSQRSVIIELARLNRILEIDYANLRAVVQPGVINIKLSQAVAARNYHYAPDPSRQRPCP